MNEVAWTRKNILLMTLLFTVAAVVLGFSNNLLRGYVSLRFAFLLLGTSVMAWGIVLHALERDPVLAGKKALWFALAAEAGALILSIFVSSIPLVSLLGSMPRMMGAMTYWSYLILAAGTVLVISDRKDRLILLLRVLMVVAIAVSVQSFHELPGVRGFRAPGVLGNPDFLGNWLLAVFFAGFSLMLIEKNRGAAVLSGLATAMGLIAVAYTRTRGAWLGLTTAMTIFFLLTRIREEDAKRVRTRTVLWGAGVVLITLGLLIAFQMDWAQQAILHLTKKIVKGASQARLDQVHRTYVKKFTHDMHTMAALGVLWAAILVAWAQIATRWRHWSAGIKAAALGAIGIVVLIGVGALWGTAVGKEIRHKQLRLHFKNEGRSIIWRDTATKMIPKIWYKGCGIEVFRVAFLPYKSVDLAQNDPRVNWRNPHDVIMYELSSNGIVGLTTFLAVVLLTLWTLLIARKQAMNQTIGLLVCGVTASLVGYLVHNLVNYDIIPTGMTFYLLVAMAQSLKVMTAPKVEGAAVQTSQEKPDENPAQGKVTKALKTRKSGKADQKKNDKQKKKTQSDKAAAPKTARRAPRPEPIPPGVTIALALLFVVTMIPFVVAVQRHFPTKLWLGATPLIFWAIVLPALFAPEARRFAWRPNRAWIGLAASYSIVWLLVAVPSIWSNELAKAAGKDPFRWLFATVIDGVWLLALWTPAAFAGADGQSSKKTSRFIRAVQGVVLAVLVALAGTYAYWHLQADWNLFRAKGFARLAGRTTGRRIDQITNAAHRVAVALRSGRGDKQKLHTQLLHLRELEIKETNKMKALLKKVRRYGRKGTRHFRFMGFLPRQYSKALQAFVRQPNALPTDLGNQVMDEAIRYARYGTKNNTNPESAYSHLAVLYYWSLRYCRTKPAADRAECRRTRLGRSIKALDRSMSYDRYYYDTHRMKAYILARQRKVVEALKELRFAMFIIKGRLHKFPNVGQVSHAIMEQVLRKPIMAAKQQQWQQVIDQTKQILTRYGEPMAFAHLIMGRAAIKLNQNDLAKQELAVAIKERQPEDYPDARLDLARVYFVENQFDAGNAILRPLMQPTIKKPQALLIHAWGLQKQGKFADAISDYVRFLELRPKWPQKKAILKKIRQLQARLNQ
ncbi:MAG: hypothetical protein J7M25_03295 [Deltaproteobacteria bacterium]|nr:hypothetical protein [Deltaproteobacteria bacterium]